MKKPFFLFICFFFVLHGLSLRAQNLELIRSLRHKLTTTPEAERFEIFNDLAWEYRWAAPDSTIFYAQKAYALGQDLKLATGLAKPLNFIGVARNYQGKRLEAFDAYDKALNTATQQNDSVQIAYSNNNLGRLFFEQGLLSRSYDYFLRAQALFENINDSSGLAYTYQSLANLYKLQQDNAKAESNYLKAYRIRMHGGRTRDIMAALVMIGRLYQETGQLDKALQYLHRADSIGHVINDEINLADIKTYMSEALLNKGQLNAADSMCTAGLAVIVRMNTTRMMPQAYMTMGQIKFAKNELAQARKYFTLAMEVATRANELNTKMEVFYWLWKLSLKENNRAGALENQNQYLILKDSLNDLNVARQVERLQFEMDIERKEQENELLKVNHAKNEAVILQQRLQNIILIVIIAFISILGLVQWRGSKKRREVNDMLERQNQFIRSQREEIVDQNQTLSKHNRQLSDINHEKDTLMSIVAHDLKAPLNRIKGIADIMELEGGLTTDQHEYMDMTKNATQAGLDLIKDLLDVHMLEENVTPHYTTFDISAFMLEKVDAFTPIASAKQIHLHITRVESEQVRLDADYLSRIADNLLSNALKFSPSNGTVEVAAGKTADHFWFSVRDEGPGFSGDDKQLMFQKFRKLTARPTAGETSNGLGLAIVKTLVDRLKGEIILNSEPGKGSEFVIRFPLG
ncbi:tetratricopeptide repeat-containing sensor histidine kinase [Fulvivirgaceae bacterium PWU5]|uniref:histidine kinase n=1 Tax=Dawidia cretensis TaxID=2782350 RepID=A0AAP2DX94_9BACT|nr:ATP-binding protein [Dawidia cretensis]MBT1709103.1 tetratricopeptide repeat-containing sensor histidine kinase [Dawidia cretensis]